MDNGTTDMHAFQSLLGHFCDRAGIQAVGEEELIDELVQILKQVKKHKNDAPFSEEGVRAALFGWTNPHPCFFRWIVKALKLSEEEIMRLAWAFLYRDSRWPADWRPHAIALT